MPSLHRVFALIKEEAAQCPSKSIIVTSITLLCCWFICVHGVVFFLFLSPLLINAGFFYSRRSTYANIKSKRRLFNFSIYMFCLYASASRRSTDYL